MLKKYYHSIYDKRHAEKFEWLRKQELLNKKPGGVKGVLPSGKLMQLVFNLPDSKLRTCYNVIDRYRELNK